MLLQSFKIFYFIGKSNIKTRLCEIMTKRFIAVFYNNFEAIVIAVNIQTLYLLSVARLFSLFYKSV